MAGDIPAPPSSADAAQQNAPVEAGAAHGGRGQGFWALALGSVGVVFGDIGTSPLYAMREALHHSRSDSSELAVLGVVSLVLWALTLIVTLKYVVFLMRADNKGEGGTLALMALAQRALGRRSKLIFFLGIIGASLFYGDGIITPAISVLSSVELVKEAPGVGEGFNNWVIPISAAILVGLFMVQAKGTHRVASFFGPITALWFLTLAGLGLLHISDDWSVLRAFSPYYGAAFLLDNGLVGFIILGSVFLAVTGAEALYADMGHFGKKPIRAAWMAVFACLALNYLGQGALVLSDPTAIDNPFAHMAPEIFYWPILILAVAATIIASQAVITGAFSLTQQAVGLGLLPRMDIKRTSETQAGQIYVPSINTFLMVGVLVLLAGAGLMAKPEILGPTGLVLQPEKLPSSVLASAYGIAVTGAMFVDTLLAYFVVRWMFKWRLLPTLALLVPLGIIDVVFISSNLLKIPDGAWLPLVLGAGLVMLMWTWNRGTEILTEKSRRDSVPLCDLIDIMRARAPHRVPGTAIFLTSDPDMTPVALMHNLKHNKVLHEKNVVLTVRTAETPRVAPENRIRIEPLNEDFKKVIVSYGFMESPNVPKALTLLRKQQGLKFDIMATSFFLGRRSVVPSANSGMPLWQDKVFIFLVRNATNPTDFFKIPYGRVVELGAQVTV
jgi:KUP system potassium uptake protein